jgi:hypothetical protein
MNLRARTCGGGGESNLTMARAGEILIGYYISSALIAGKTKRAVEAAETITSLSFSRSACII